jgi:hypothetical protein
VLLVAVDTSNACGKASPLRNDICTFSSQFKLFSVSQFSISLQGRSSLKSQAGGKAGTVAKIAAIAAPHDGGAALSILLRINVDVLTLSNRDLSGGLLYAILALPKGQGKQQRAQLIAAGAHLRCSTMVRMGIPTGYFHVVFTVPHELNVLALPDTASIFPASHFSDYVLRIRDRTPPITPPDVWKIRAFSRVPLSTPCYADHTNLRKNVFKGSCTTRGACLMYDLHNLGWHRFQQLCLTVCGEVLDQTVESFLHTADAGQDGAFSGAWKRPAKERLTGRFVIQCKFTSKRELNLRASDLEAREVPL